MGARRRANRLQGIANIAAAVIALTLSVTFLLGCAPQDAGRAPTLSGEDSPTPDTSVTAPATEPPLGTQPVRPGQRAQEILDRCIEGRMAFRPPSPLKQGETVEFTVRVAPGTSTIDPADELPGTGAPTRRKPPLCEHMVAVLTSSNGGIQIERTTDERISLPEAGAGEWRWRLTGIKSGPQKMSLVLSAPDPGGGTITVKTFEETIIVDVGLTYRVSTFIKEMSQPLSALLTAIGVVGGWVGWIFVRKRRGEHAKTGAEK